MSLAFRKQLGQVWLCYLALIFISILAFEPMIYGQSFSPQFLNVNDFLPHIKMAVFLNQGLDKVPASMLPLSDWQVLVVGVMNIFAIKPRAASFLVTLFSILMSNLFLFGWMLPVLQKRGLSPWWGVLLALGLSLVAPVALIAILDRKLYVGYLGLITYHNPTIMLLRPLAILQFIYAARSFTNRPASWLEILFVAIVSTLANFAKPNYSICIIPAISILAVFYLWKKQALDWKMLVFGFGLPLVISLALQYMVVYQDNNSRGIIFFPGGTLTMYSGYLLPKFLLSLVFPLALAVFYWPQIRKDPRQLLAWISFAFGVIYSYFIAEGGDHFKDGNFTWSGEITLYILFCASTIYWLENHRQGLLKEWQLITAWSLHLAFGLLYYLHYFFTFLYY